MSYCEEGDLKLGGGGHCSPGWGDAPPNVGQLRDAGGVRAGVFCVFWLCSAQLGVVLCFHQMFHEEKMAHKKMWIPVKLMKFPTVSIPLEHMYDFKMELGQNWLY